MAPFREALYYLVGGTTYNANLFAASDTFAEARSVKFVEIKPSKKERSLPTPN
jgi:hypothetical protein